MCASIAGKRGKSVLVLDHAEKPGKKILISGGGRCNFTNLFVTAENYISANPHFCKSALSRFSAYDFLDMVEHHRIGWEERDHGQLFCTHSAKDIVEMLLSECRAGNVTLTMNCDIQSISRTDLFEITTSRQTYKAKKLVVATGGLSIPKIGASSFGLKLAGQFNLNIQPLQAALVPLTLTGHQKDAFKQLAGISLDVIISCHGQQFREAMLFTHRGLSGPAILQISSYWSPGDTLNIDLLPGQNIQEALTQLRQQQPNAKLSTALTKFLPKRLCQLLCESVLQDQTLKSINPQQLETIADQLHQWQLKPAASEGYRTAEATRGGVDTHELSSKTMECRKVPGLYFIGEVVDVTGHLGGFNFQWAWSSGYACGQSL